jgi:hypothetical protein
MQGFKPCVFGSVAAKALTNSICGCVANERLSGEMGKRCRGVGIPLLPWKKESRNGRKGKEIESVFRCKTTGLQWGLNGAMKGRELEESNARVLGSWSGALGARFFSAACNLMCVGVASIIRLH